LTKNHRKREFFTHLTVLR